MRRFLDTAPREDRALALLMVACLIVFVAQWPRLSREAYLTGQELNPLLGGALMAWMFIAPLLLYLIAFLSHLILCALKRPSTGYGARMALFWAFLAASPLLLLHGLVMGFIGQGIENSIVGGIWVLVFLWFWMSNLKEVGWKSA
jgi:hypothetical protein